MGWWHPSNTLELIPADPISFVGSNWSAANNVSIPGGHAAGDLMIGYSRNNGVITPSLPSGWTNIGNAGTFGNNVRAAYKYATSGSESAVTFSNSSHNYVIVFRGCTKGVHAGVGTSTSWPALSGFSTDAWLVRICLTVNSFVTPTGFTARGGHTSGSLRIFGFDTDGPHGSTSISAETMSPAVNSFPLTLALEPA